MDDETTRAERKITETDQQEPPWLAGAREINERTTAKIFAQVPLVAAYSEDAAAPAS